MLFCGTVWRIREHQTLQPNPTQLNFLCVPIFFPLLLRLRPQLIHFLPPFPLIFSPSLFSPLPPFFSPPLPSSPLFFPSSLSPPSDLICSLLPLFPVLYLSLSHILPLPSYHTRLLPFYLPLSISPFSSPSLSLSLFLLHPSLLLFLPHLFPHFLQLTFPSYFSHVYSPFLPRSLLSFSSGLYASITSTKP